jgi:hypothetical protein
MWQEVLMRHICRPFLTVLLGCAAVSVLAAPVFAQAPVVARSAQPAEPEAQARQVRETFVREVLAKYPPAVAGVLKLDPTLLSSEPYMAAYPEINAYLSKHPEIRRSPSYYFENVSSGQSYSYDPRARAWDNMMDGLAVFMVMLLIAGSLGWLVRTAIDYRRWGRLAKVQAEAHTKLLDRFTGNEELLSYVKSPAGMRFLQSSPIALDGNPRAMSAPLSRILWSVQAGVVMASAGLGMNYVSRKIYPEYADPVFTLSVVVLSIGLGFLASAVLSYLLSQRMGLLVKPSAQDVGEV